MCSAHGSPLLVSLLVSIKVKQYKNTSYTIEATCAQGIKISYVLVIFHSESIDAAKDNICDSIYTYIHILIRLAGTVCFDPH
jgi:hypothetical protein